MESNRWPESVQTGASQPLISRGQRAGADQQIAGRGSYGSLSRREREVLRLIAIGKTDRQIADDLFISRITVSNHVVHILDKLNVPNRTAAAAIAAANAFAVAQNHMDFPENDEFS